MRRFVVTNTDVSSILNYLSSRPELVLDTETTGLRWYKNDRLFSIQICDGETAYYFNFQAYDGLDSIYVLDKDFVFSKLQDQIFGNDQITKIGHNINFDAHMVEADGMLLEGRLHDTMVHDQILYNQHVEGYSLDSVASRHALKKDDAVEKYIDLHDLYDRGIDELIGKEFRNPRYDKVPFEIMSEYGMTDVEITWQIYEIQKERIAGAKFNDPHSRVHEIETQVAPIWIKIERDGIRVDRAYAKEAFEYEKDNIAAIEREWKSLSGTDFVDSAKSLGYFLGTIGITLPKTPPTLSNPEGNPSVANWVLEDIDHPAVKLILKHRDSAKRAHTYFANILQYADDDGFIHPQFKSRGAWATGRASGSQPNMQNVTKGEDSLYPIRKAFLPRYDFFCEKDYMAQEFRLTVDYAEEKALAAQILAGMNPHTVTADMTGLEYKAAKVLNFALLYGVGLAKLSKMLGCTIEEAQVMKARYFYRLQGIKNFLRNTKAAAEGKGFVRGWDGMLYNFPDKTKGYRAANAVIQGGAASICKQGMINVDAYLRKFGLKMKLITQVHDSLLFDVPENEKHHLPALDQLMIDAYPHFTCPMGVSTEYSRTNWHELKAEL